MGNIIKTRKHDTKSANKKLKLKKQTVKDLSPEETGGQGIKGGGVINNVIKGIGGAVAGVAKSAATC